MDSVNQTVVNQRLFWNMSRPFVRVLITVLLLLAFQAKQAQMVSDVFIHTPHTITPSALHGSAAERHQNTLQSHADCCDEFAHCATSGCVMSALLTADASIQPIPLQRNAGVFTLASTRAGYFTPPLRPPNT